MAVRLAKASAVSALVLAVAGCGAFSDKPPGPCPAVVPIGDASRLTKFNGEGTDLTQVANDDHGR